MKVRALATSLMIGGALLALPLSAQYYGQGLGEMGSNRVPSSANIRGVGLEQRLGNQVPVDVPLVDEEGRSLTFGEATAGTPTVLLLIFYNCTGICSDELAQMAETLKAFGPNELGPNFNVVNISIDPTETPEIARARKSQYMMELRNDWAGDHWRFLTGTEEDVRRIADAVGFEFRIDPATGSINHPAGAMVLTANNQVSNYILRPEYPAEPLRRMIQRAGDNEIGARAEPFFLNCIMIDPLTGQMSLNVMNTLKVLGITTVFILGLSIFFMSRTRRQSEASEAEAHS